jgi:hypothetical protein
VLEIVTTVLKLAGERMRAHEIHAVACELSGEPIRWSSVKGILSAHTIGGDRRFQRIRRGCYELTPGSRESEFLNRREPASVRGAGDDEVGRHDPRKPVAITSRPW